MTVRKRLVVLACLQLIFILVGKTVETTSKINYLIAILTNTLEVFREYITGASTLDWDLKREKRENSKQREERVGRS